MGQESDSGRHAALNEKKERSAGSMGRTGQSSPGKEEITDAGAAKGATGGAFGKEGLANRCGGVGTQGGGGGGGESSSERRNENATPKED